MKHWQIWNMSKRKVDGVLILKWWVCQKNERWDGCPSELLRTRHAGVPGQEWMDKRWSAGEKWEGKLIIYSLQVLAHYWDCAVLFTICKTLTEPLAAAGRPSSQGQTQTQLYSLTTVCPPTPVNPLGKWTRCLFALMWTTSVRVYMYLYVKYMTIHMFVSKATYSIMYISNMESIKLLFVLDFML